MDNALFLDDFEAEAKEHIGKIETAFMDVGGISEDLNAMRGIFRAAHSLKGTAGFFSQDKIVSVAHELESLFTRIINNELIIDENVADAVLRCVDCLRDLIDGIRSDGNVEIDETIEQLRSFERHNIQAVSEEPETPFDFSHPETLNHIKKATKRGHKIYHVTIRYNRGLGKYYRNPGELLDNILSVGAVAEAFVDAESDNKIRGSDPQALTGQILATLTQQDTSNLSLLVTTVLEQELFSIAADIDGRNIKQLSKDAALNEIAADIAKPPIPPVVTQIQPVLTDTVVQASKQPVTPQLHQQSGENLHIRLNVSVINQLMDLANEMILTRNQLLSAVSGYKKNIGGLPPILIDLNRLTGEIQERVMLTRMQPIAVIFSKFPRIIRETAKQLNKEIKVDITGGEITLDKYLLESLTDPITQLIKNSADHGIERPERRAERGKPASGKITLNAYRHESSVVIEVNDDGAGINLEILRRKCLERGITTDEAFTSMTRSEKYMFLFEPGVSTAEKVTNLSGRGVGMDIVKTNIEKLGGTIEVESKLDFGTTIRLRMPPSLSVIRTLIVMIDGVPYAAPESHVERIIRVSRGLGSKYIETLNKSLVLCFGGRVLPLITMDEIVSRASGGEAPDVRDVIKRLEVLETVKCLVMRAGGKCFALLIDDALETVETLVKPLPVYLASCFCFSNVTILGNGNAVTVLDAEGIIRQMGIEETKAAVKPEENNTALGEQRQVVLFKCSGNEFYALETHEISRIESIQTRDIQEIGDAKFINIAGATIEIIRPEDFTPVCKREYHEPKLCLLTLKASQTGFLALKVLDIVKRGFRIDSDRLYSDFIHGTSEYDEKILIFLNASAIADEVEREKLRMKNRGSDSGSMTGTII